MYELEGLGARLQKLRKQKGMTQEDLAHRIGVTGQAVSKWETDQSYPDITLITTLATILEADIHHLFGKKETVPALAVSVSNFPEKLNDMPMVHSAQGVACYSNKTVHSVDATGVKFIDGSTAELSNRLAVNLGKGEIKFVGDDNVINSKWQHIDHSVTSMSKEFGTTESVEIEINTSRCECRILPSHDGKTKVNAFGDAVFIHLLNVEVSGKTLKISQKPDGHVNSNSEITIEMPCEVGEHADITINSAANVTSEIAKFNNGTICINGAGTVKMQEFVHFSSVINGSGEIAGTHADALMATINGSGIIDWGTSASAMATINGSGDIKFASAAALKVGINGSGVIDVEEMTGENFSAKINGSGSIDLKSGSCDTFTADISGSGDIDASGLTTREANIVLHQDGNVTLGRVQERSTEQIKKKGTIKILKRGRED